MIHERDGWIDKDPSPTTCTSELLVDWTFASLLPAQLPSTMTSMHVARILGNACESWKAVSIALCFLETRSFHKLTCMMPPPSASMKLKTFLTLNWGGSSRQGWLCLHFFGRFLGRFRMCQLRSCTSPLELVSQIGFQQPQPICRPGNVPRRRVP